MPRDTFLSCFHLTKTQAGRAFRSVQRELRAVGLMQPGDELSSVECEWHPCGVGSFAVTGYGFSDCATEGYYWNRTIHLPAWGYWFRSCDGFRNVVRHEFGHAIAEMNKALFKSELFRKAFGAPYGKREVRRFKLNPWETCVSKYASSYSQEDWAETFMLFIQHKGKLPARFQGLPAIEAKWQTTRKILSKLGWKLYAIRPYLQ